MAEHAVIFDVDGVLLELTHVEEELFFQPFAQYCDISKLSRDWNSYRIRNDEDILNEICETFGIENYSEIKAEYFELLRRNLNCSYSNQIKNRHSRAGMTVIVDGADLLLREFFTVAKLGIATANFREAAKLRLQNVALWNFVEDCAFGADGGGHKRDILNRALAELHLPKSRVVFIGDNVNDVEAGLLNGVHFIGFSENRIRLKKLGEAGAIHLCSNHSETSAMIKTLLAL